MEIKKCKACGEEKNIDDFPKYKAKGDISCLFYVINKCGSALESTNRKAWEGNSKP